MFNMIMYVVIYAANKDSNVDTIGSYSDFDNLVNGTTGENMNTANVANWYDGFRVSVFTGGIWWFDLFYITFQGLLISVGAFALIRGLN